MKERKMPGIFSVLILMVVLSWTANSNATLLPPDLVTLLNLPGVTIGTDGSVHVGALQFTPFLPPGYDPGGYPPIVLSTVTVGPDGSILFPGGLQLVPISPTIGGYPVFPTGFAPQAGNQLPADFQPPAGLIVPSGVGLPTGVTVPALTPSGIISNLVRDGVIPAGWMTVGEDGAFSIPGIGSFVPFQPVDHFGVYDPANPNGISLDPVSGAAIFPDGTTYALLVDGPNPGEVTLAANFSAPAGNLLPENIDLPPLFRIPANMPLTSGMSLPPGVQFPETAPFTVPPNIALPPGVSIPANVTLGSGVLVPPGIRLPSGTTVSNAQLPEGTAVLPDGSVVIPGLAVPEGVSPPADWALPDGATRLPDGSIVLPQPPPGGFPQPPPPIRVNDDGSIVVPIPPSGLIPPVAVDNGDGTMTISPPPFIGQVMPGGAIGMPIGMGMPPGFVPPPGGMLPPGFGVSGPAPVMNPDGTITVPAPPPGAPLPPGAVQNADGTVTLQPPPGFVPFTPPGGGTPPPGGEPPPPGGGTPPPGGEPPPPGGGTPPPGGGTPPPGGGTPPPGGGPLPPGGGTPPPGGGPLPPGGGPLPPGGEPPPPGGPLG